MKLQVKTVEMRCYVTKFRHFKSPDLLEKKIIYLTISNSTSVCTSVGEGGSITSPKHSPMYCGKILSTTLSPFAALEELELAHKEGTSLFLMENEFFLKLKICLLVAQFFIILGVVDHFPLILDYTMDVTTSGKQ